MKIVTKSIIPITLMAIFVIGADFIRDDAKEIVTDNETGLQWQDDKAVADDNNRKNWQEAITHCESLSLDGGGWRLPNIRELLSIVDDSNSKIPIYPIFKYVGTISKNSYLYWSSTSRSNSLNAFSVLFVSGSSGEYPKDFSFFIRCVR